MIVNEKQNRFMSNFGVDPNSVALKYNWTTPYDAENIEMAGKAFSKESDFGNGLNGLGGLSRRGGLGNFLTDITDLFSRMWSDAHPRQADEYEAFAGSEGGGAATGFGTPNGIINTDVAQHQRNLTTSSPLAAGANRGTDAIAAALATSSESLPPSQSIPDWQRTLQVYDPNVNSTQRGFNPGSKSNTMTYGAFLDQEASNPGFIPTGNPSGNPFDWSKALSGLGGLGALGFDLPTDFANGTGGDGMTSSTSYDLNSLLNMSFFGLSLPVLALLGVGGYMLVSKGGGLLGDAKASKRRTAKKKARVKRLEADLLEAAA